MSKNIQTYVHRRAQFLKALPANSLALFAASREHIRNGDSHYAFRQDSDFYYLTGFNEPESVAVFIPNRPEGEFILFCRTRNPEKEIWEGPRAGQEGACAIYGAHQAFPIESLSAEMLKLLLHKQAIYYPLTKNTYLHKRVLSWVKTSQAYTRKGIHVPTELRDASKIVHEMRLFKTPDEIALMRKAADISAEAHCAAMKICKPGLYEYELEAEIQATFLRHGARTPAYSHIIGAGKNSCILHYNDNNHQIKTEDLVLIDAGAEYGNYASDVTRTFPASGHFSEPQKAIYEAVLNTQMAIIEAIKPGVRWDALQTLSEQMLTEALVDLGLLTGAVSELMKEKACAKFYMHRFGHWLGMDVHDAGTYMDHEGNWRALAPNMVLTVEPGLYIPAHMQGVDSKWWNIGVRIEDDVLVTASGCEVLSAGAPKTVEDIEFLMQTKQK